MALQFVPGNSGAGKSFQLYQKILQEAGTHPERKYLVIVPEQFTMQTQKDLCLAHPKGATGGCAPRFQHHGFSYGHAHGP